jgi:PAS domain-containing protein
MPQLTFSQLTFLIATGLGVAALLILGALAFKKVRSGQWGYAASKTPLPRVQDQTAFVAAAFQGVVKELKEQQKRLEQLLRAAEQRAETNLRHFAVISSEMGEGVVQVNRDGSIVFANPAARSLLEMATLSHRLYSEVFGADTKLCQSIRACLEEGVATRGQQVDYQCPNRKVRPLQATVVPLTTRQDIVEGAICLLRGFPGDRSVPGPSEPVK